MRIKEGSKTQRTGVPSSLQRWSRKHLPHCKEGDGKNQRDKGVQEKKEGQDQIIKGEIKKGITVVQKEGRNAGWKEGMKKGTKELASAHKKEGGHA